MKTSLQIIILMLFALLAVNLHSGLWEVNQDGGGDFNTIQAAVDNAADGDSILVYPGRYVETVDFLGKSISLLSLSITTGVDDYVGQTVIDADEKGTAVTIKNCNDAYLGGFTITGGSGSTVPYHFPLTAGGLYVNESKAFIEDCYVTGNYAVVSGGVHLRHSRVHFRGNTITENAAEYGGGLGIVHGETENYYIFDEEKKNNIYINTAIVGQDIYGTAIPYLEIPLGKANVLHQDPYFYHFHESCGEVVVYADSAVIDQKEADLYVATWGSDDNSGLTPDDPLQRISYALMKVKADSHNPRTVFVAEGLYSPSETGELLPLHFKPYVTLTAMTEDTRWTIDAEGKTGLGGTRATRNKSGDITVRNGVFKRGLVRSPPVMMYSNGHKAIFENIDIKDLIPRSYNHFFGAYAIGIGSFEDVLVRNVRVFGNPNGGGVSLGVACIYLQSLVDTTALVDRVLVEDVTGVGILLKGTNHSKLGSIILSNSLMRSGSSYRNWFIDAALSLSGSDFEVPIDRNEIRVINCTIADNDYADAAVSVRGRLTSEFYNNIVYGNEPSRIRLNGTHSPGRVYFSHNLFENGLDDIEAIGQHYFTYDNIMKGDPLFIRAIEHPYIYKLSKGSPAINAGTTDIPGYTFEEYDLAGEPRIVGDSIDLGAYEYQRSTGVGDNLSQKKISSYAYPNPVKMGRYRGNIHCTISFDMPSAGDVIVAVYNIRGQRVKTLINAYTGKGEHNVYWDGTDNSGNRVGSGMYMYRIETVDMEATGSIMLVK